MLVREGHFFDLKVVMYAQEAVDINAQGMRSQLRVKAST